MGITEEKVLSARQAAVEALNSYLDAQYRAMHAKPSDRNAAIKEADDAAAKSDASFDVFHALAMAMAMATKKSAMTQP